MENELTKLSNTEQITAGLIDACQRVQVGTTFDSIATRAKSRTLELGMRVCQLYFVAVLAGALGYALITNPGDFA